MGFFGQAEDHVAGHGKQAGPEVIEQHFGDVKQSGRDWCFLDTYVCKSYPPYSINVWLARRLAAASRECGMCVVGAFVDASFFDALPPVDLCNDDLNRMVHCHNWFVCYHVCV